MPPDLTSIATNTPSAFKQEIHFRPVLKGRRPVVPLIAEIPVVLVRSDRLCDQPFKQDATFFRCSRSLLVFHGTHYARIAPEPFGQLPFPHTQFCLERRQSEAQQRLLENIQVTGHCRP